jgi:hypothetical protein
MWWGIKINMNYIIAGIVLFIILLIIYFYVRDSPSNNMRRARRHHKLGEKHNKLDDDGEAKLHYEAAKYYREKALEQMGEL